MNFEGKIEYKHLTGKSDRFLYHSNFKKIVCTYKKGFFKEDFWANKNEHYYSKIYDSEAGKIFQINHNKKTIQEKEIRHLKEPKITNVKTSESITINDMDFECVQYKSEYELDFGFVGQTITKSVLDKKLELYKGDQKYCSIVSKHNLNNNKISEYHETINNNRYVSNKGMHKTEIQTIKIDQKEFSIKQFSKYQIFNEGIEIYNENTKYKKAKWYPEFKKMMIAYYEEELNCELNDEIKENICAYNIVHFGILNAAEYEELNSKLLKYKTKYDL